jgi:tetratricopeptide (TPR) repeat protein
MVVAVGLLGVSACAPDTPPAATLPPAGAADFESAIARLDVRDPESPEALNARLEYADFLSGSDTGDCAKRQDTAQAQLDAKSARPALRVVLPLGPAKLQSAEYKIHAARADCDPGRRQDELKQALEAARKAAGLYRDALDYQSAAIMQFNTAATEHDLGDAQGAISALQAAIEMDRDYGFRGDAEDNVRLLQHWRGEDESDAKIAELMKDFPARSAEFKFHWPSADADIAVTVTDNSLVHGEVIGSRATIGLKHQIRPTPTGWTVSNEPGDSRYEVGIWPADAKKSEWSMLYFLTSALLLAPGIQINRNGDFNSVPNSRAFATSLADQVSARISAEIGGSVTENARELRAAFSPDFVESSAAQDYGIRTATWIGAKLDQGAWYQMSTPLYLPSLALGHYLVHHNVSFAFTRELPCGAGSDRICAEIAAHATPDAGDLNQVIAEVAQQFKLSSPQFLQYWSQTDLRLVIDPQTLLTYVCDIKRTWYVGLGGSGKTDPLSESVRTVSTYTYH